MSDETSVENTESEGTETVVERDMSKDPFRVYFKNEDGSIDESKIYASGESEDAAWDDFEAKEIWKQFDKTVRFACCVDDDYELPEEDLEELEA